VDKTCRITMQLVPMERIVLNGLDLHVAADRGVDRLRPTVTRRVRRSRSATVGRAALRMVRMFGELLPRER
jgi:hypothetical protein